MKRENEKNRELVKLLREKLPRGVAWKHNDRETSGIPDVSVTCKARTVWIECKFVDNPLAIKRADPFNYVEVVPRRDVPGLQWENLRKCGNGYLVVYTNWGVALTHVNGYRASVGVMRLRLEPIEAIVARVVNIVKNRKEEE